MTTAVATAPADLHREFLRTGDPELCRQVVDAHAGLAHRLASRFGNRGESPDDLTPYLSETDGDAVTAHLIAFANAAGGKDNITAVLVRLGEGTVDDSARARKLALKREVRRWI